MIVAATLLCSACFVGEEIKPAFGGVGESLEAGDLKVKLVSVEEYVDTDEFAVDVPDEGKMFIVLNFTVENVGSEADYFNMLYEESYCDDTAIDTTMLFDHSGSEVWGDVAAGKKRTGYVAYEVSRDFEKLDFTYQWDMWDDNAQITFTVYRNDVQS